MRVAVLYPSARNGVYLNAIDHAGINTMLAKVPTVKGASECLRQYIGLGRMHHSGRFGLGLLQFKGCLLHIPGVPANEHQEFSGLTS